MYGIAKTVEDLDALPKGSIILDSDDRVLPKVDGPYECGWQFDNCCGRAIESAKVPLPARVLFIPDVEIETEWGVGFDGGLPARTEPENFARGMADGTSNVGGLLMTRKVGPWTEAT